MVDSLSPAEFAKLRSLPPAEAAAWMQARGRVATTFSWQDLWEAEHGEQFTVSRLARMDLLEALRDGITKSVSGDLTRADWMRNAEQLLAQAGWWGVKSVVDPATGKAVTTTFDPARLKLIFDTNTRMAYAAGQWERIQRTKRALPYLRYVTKRDGRVRPLHQSWDNVTLPVDDVFWQTHAPPNGYRCRCSIVQVSQSEYDAGRSPTGAALKTTRPDMVTTTFVNQRTGEISTVPAGIDPGFGYNVGAARMAAMKDVISAKLAQTAPQIARAATAAGLERPGRATLPGSNTTASVWTHPATGQVRVYINNLGNQRSAKVWVEQQEADTFGYELRVRVASQMLNRSEASNLVNDVEGFLDALAGRRIKTWKELMQLLGM